MPRWRSLLLFLTLAGPALAQPGFAARGSDVTLWLAGDYRSRSEWGREFRASFGVNLPWERLWSPRRAPLRARMGDAVQGAPSPEGPSRAPSNEAHPTQRVAEPETNGAEETDPAPRVESEGESRSEAPALGEPRSVGRGGEPTGPPGRVLTAALTRETLRHALGAQGFESSERRMRSLDSRSRWSALLPDLALKAARATDQSLRLTPTISDPYRYTRDGGTDLVFEAKLSWRLSRLLFADPELSVERLRLGRAQKRAELSRQVLKALFAWQRAVVKVRDPGAFPEERQSALLDQVEAELTLHLLTGGWFTSERARAFSRRRKRGSAEAHAK